MKLEILKTDGTKSGKSVTLPAEIFGIEPNEHAVYLAVKHYLASQRQGTHKSKEKSEVSGSTRKLHKQKGTGGSRKGSIKAPQFVGGGRVFGPKPRDYSFKLNAKVKELARASALSSKAKENSISVIEDFTIESGKTKDYANILKTLGLNNKKTLLVVAKADDTIKRATRNIQNSQLVTPNNLNTYEVMRANMLLFTESSLKGLTGK
jgi:large subunit ribosomal protein L4